MAPWRGYSLLHFLALFISTRLLSSAPVTAVQVVHESRDDDLSSDTGWKSLPDVPGAVIDRSFEVRPGGPVLVNYVTAHYDPQKIKRVVVQIHGDGRDAWHYWDHTYNALLNATAWHPGAIALDEVVIFAPEFFNGQDKGAFPWTDDLKSGRGATSNELVWVGNQWIQGQNNEYPENTTDVSSFECLDAVVSHFSDLAAFPNMKTIVIAGHSAGGQIVQRYAALGRIPQGSAVGVHYWVANPGSFVYWNADRPNGTAGCANTFNSWKFGWENYTQLYANYLVTKNFDAILPQYQSRIINYAFGLDDFGDSDNSCEAQSQGDYHLIRGSNYMSHLDSLPGGWPSAQTVDYIADASHNPVEMLNSAQGIQRVFLDNYNDSSAASTTAAAVTSAVAGFVPTGLTDGKGRPYTVSVSSAAFPFASSASTSTSGGGKEMHSDAAPAALVCATVVVLVVVVVSWGV